MDDDRGKCRQNDMFMVGKKRKDIDRISAFTINQLLIDWADQS